MYVEQSSEG